MATNVFDLYAKLGLDSSAFTNGLSMAMNAVGVAVKEITKIGAASVKTGAEFDKSMSQVAATMGKTVGEITELRDFAQEMGRATAFSATQAADALNYMALAGYDAETSMSMLPNVLNLASAGSMDLARASDMVTDTQTAFGISLERTSQMVDEMAKAASTGNTSVEQLGDAFLTVGGLAQELNGGIVTLEDGTEVAVDGIQELEIALTAMANAGIKGSEAGTHMRNMLMKLSSPSAEGTKALEAMGVAVFDTEGNMRSLADIFGDLSDAMGDMTQQQKIQTISDLFNARDIASAEAMLNAVSQDWDKIGASILDAEGAASKMAETQLDNLAGDVTLFKSALEGAQIAISDKLTNGLRKFVQFGTSGLSRMTEAFESGGFKGAMKEFGSILSDGIAMLIEMMPELIEAGMEMVGALVEGLIENAPLLIDAAINIVTMLADYLIEELPILIPAIVDMILTIVDKLTEPDTLMMLLDAAIAIMIALAEGLINALPKLIEKAPVIVEHLVEAIIEATPKLINAAIQLLVVLVAGIVENLDKLIEAGMEIVGAIIVGIVEWLGRLIMIGADIGNSIKEGFWDFIEGAKQWGSDLIQNFISGITQKWADLKDKVKGVAGMVKDYLGFSEPEKGPLSDFHTYAPDMMELFAKGITNNARLITDAIGNTFNLESSIAKSTSSASLAGAGIGGDIVIPVYIGQDRIDEVIIRANKVNDYITGGRG